MQVEFYLQVKFMNLKICLNREMQQKVFPAFISHLNDFIIISKTYYQSFFLNLIINNRRARRYKINVFFASFDNDSSLSKKIIFLFLIAFHSKEYDFSIPYNGDYYIYILFILNAMNV